MTEGRTSLATYQLHGTSKNYLIGWGTSCRERQDALYEITDDPTIDMMIVVGGFNSSNTSHLQVSGRTCGGIAEAAGEGNLALPTAAAARHLSVSLSCKLVALSVCASPNGRLAGRQGSMEIPHNKGLPAYWVDTADRIDMANNTIAHKLHYGELKVTENWLPEGPLTIGVTSGASTPDRAVCWKQILFTMWHHGFFIVLGCIGVQGVIAPEDRTQVPGLSCAR
eukprot:1015005-Pelagomonas_calceolata.AAC.5